MLEILQTQHDEIMADVKRGLETQEEKIKFPAPMIKALRQDVLDSVVEDIRKLIVNESQKYKLISIDAMELPDSSIILMCCYHTGRERQ